MIDLCKECIHKDEPCIILEFPCLEYEPRECDEQKEGEEK